MISIRYSIPPPLISRYTSVISEATGFNYIAIRRHIVGFNPCFLEGRDYRCKTAKLISKPFQSTLPRRERRFFQIFRWDPIRFNPRSHEGSDRDRLLLSLDRERVSIHAPTKGATEMMKYCNSNPCVSINAPTKGATTSPFCYWYLNTVSIHAPTKGATGCIVDISPEEEVSIHAPTKGATRYH